MTAMARWASIGVAIVGLAIALYLTVVHYSGAEAFCGIGHACVTVQRSAYSELAGVPVALLGVLTYGALLGALLHDGDAARRVAAGVALTGFGFSAWLTYVEVAKLEAVCPWCVASAVCMTVLAVLTTRRAGVTAHTVGTRQTRRASA
jgi:uncharacterized membrane protein